MKHYPSTVSQKQAARAFAREWEGKGYEKGETQRFWLSLLHNVFGVEDPTAIMQFEIPVKTITKEKGSDFIDCYISSTKVLIEQKGSHVDLAGKYRQSDGVSLTPYQQARRYAAGLPHAMAPRWIVTCNFRSFEIHDMEHPSDAPETVLLSDLEKEYHRLSFLVDDFAVHLKKELEVSIKAGEIIGELYDKLLGRYINPDNPESQKSLNKLCVRLVFCFYADDAGIFGKKNLFQDYMQQFGAAEFRQALIRVFRIFCRKPEDRDPYEDERLLAFPYVNGGMFEGDIEIPRFDEEIRSLILQRASEEFDWSQISPTIFGAVFESTLNPETRRSGGMHYTSIENIHKVIDPLFLDGLKAELSDIKAISVTKTRRERAAAFCDRLASLKFFDPACGSGNFLTESYTSLRRLENEALKIIYGSDRVMGGLADPIKVSINQFYGIEINDFACSVAQTALWIAEMQMIEETDEIVGFNIDPLPLKTYTNIREGNALRMDWSDVVPANELSYIMGNPPFVGYSLQSKEQKEDILSLYVDEKGKPYSSAGKVDYVACWYFKAAQMMVGTGIRAALVSTNSITQGEQVAGVWKPLFERFGIHIDFAWSTFRWDSEASQKAHVHCVIIGFSSADNIAPKKLYDGDNVSVVGNINPYLIEGPEIFIESRTKSLCNVPEMAKGSIPVDDGNFFLDDNEYSEFVKKEPASINYIKRFYGAREFLHNEVRWCLWLHGISPSELRTMPYVMRRIQNVREFRLKSPKAATRKYADYPTRFMEIRQPDSEYMIIPRHSSENRRYIPFGYMSPNAICGDANLLIPNATLYHFGVLTSSVHMAWIRVVCGRLEMRYRYSKDIVYNNFPWPEPTEAQKSKIEKTARAILDARAEFPDSSLADLYDELTMPAALRSAHRSNDSAVLAAYGLPGDCPEPAIVSQLFKLWQSLAGKITL